jgi:lipopolysaccharide transport system permease protein
MHAFHLPAPLPGLPDYESILQIVYQFVIARTVKSQLLNSVYFVRTENMVNYFNRIVALRYFWFTLVYNDFRNRYRRSFLGVAWSLARPIGMTIVLCIVFSTFIKDTSASYAPFLFTGIAMWQFLTESILLGCTCFGEGAPYLRQQPVPVLIFPLRVVLAASIHLVISLAIAMVLTAIFIGLPSMTVLVALAPALVVVFCLGIGLATLSGLMHTHFTDTKHLLEILLQALYFLTPIIYKPQMMLENRAKLSWVVVKFNPLNAVLELVRQPLLSGEGGQAGHYADPWSWQLALMFVGVVSVLAWLGLRKLEKNLVYWV